MPSSLGGRSIVIRQQTKILQFAKFLKSHNLNSKACLGVTGIQGKQEREQEQKIGTDLHCSSNSLSVMFTYLATH